MYPVLFRIGSFEITSFGVLVAAGALVGIWVFQRELARRALPESGVDASIAGVLGAFLVLVVVWRHVRPKPPGRLSVRSFALVGAVASFLSALLGTAGPVAAPFFLSYGLIKGAYIGTEALTAVITHLTKLVAYRHAAILTGSSIGVGLMLGVVMVAGSFVGTRIVDRLPERVFVRLVEAALALTGLWFLIRG